MTYIIISPVYPTRHKIEVRSHYEFLSFNFLFIHIRFCSVYYFSFISHGKNNKETKHFFQFGDVLDRCLLKIAKGYKRMMTTIKRSLISRVLNWEYENRSLRSGV